MLSIANNIIIYLYSAKTYIGNQAINILQLLETLIFMLYSNKYQPSEAVSNMETSDSKIYLFIFNKSISHDHMIFPQTVGKNSCVVAPKYSSELTFFSLNN